MVNKAFQKSGFFLKNATTKRTLLSFSKIFLVFLISCSWYLRSVLCMFYLINFQFIQIQLRSEKKMNNSIFNGFDLKNA